MRRPDEHEGGEEMVGPHSHGHGSHGLPASGDSRFFERAASTLLAAALLLIALAVVAALS